MRMDSLKPPTTGACLLAFLTTLSPSADAGVDQGVVVEEVTHGYAGQAAGLQPGDLILSWSREANPPANPQAAEGEIRTPFDLVEVEIEQAPRGRLTLVGLRENAPASWVVPQDEWRVRTRPVLSRSLEDTYSEGLRLMRSKRVPDGVARWRLAATDSRKTEPPWLAAWLSFRAAEVLTGSREWVLADQQYASAHQILKDLAARAEVLRAWSASLHRRGHATDHVVARLSEALECEQARNAGSLAAAKTEYLLGRAQYLRGEVAEAETRYRRVLELQQQQAPQSAVVADTLATLADLEMRLRRVGGAKEYIDRALSIREATSPNGIGLAKDHVLPALLALFRSELRSAADGFRRALLRLEQLVPEGRDTAFTLTVLGTTQLRLGDFPGADESMRRSLELYERLNPDGESQGSVLYGLGQIALYRRDLDMAQSHYQRSLAVFMRSNPASPELPIALHGLGDVALEREDFAAAEEYLQRSLAINEKLGLESERTAWDLRCLSLALAGKGDLDAAREKASRSLELRERLVPGSYEVSASLATLGGIALLQGDLDASLKRYQESLAIRSRQAPGSSMEAESLYGIGRVHRRLGQLAAAAELFSRAVATLEQQGTRLGGDTEARSSFGAGYTRCYREYLEVLLELGRPVEAFHALERSRARGLLAMLAERSESVSGGAPRELVEQQQANHVAYDRVQADLSRLEPNRDDDEIERLQGRLRELREEAAQVIARVRQVSPRTASLQYPQPLDLASARAALDPGTALLAYSVGENETSLFVVQAEGALGGGLSVFGLAVGWKALRQKVEHFRHLIETPGTSSLVTEATDLYDLLVRPAEQLLSGSKRLVICPDGPLHVLPFATLMRDRVGNGARQYLVEWKPLHIVASATVYAEIKKSRKPEVFATRLALAAFGDPRFPQSQPSGEQSKDAELRRLYDRGVTLSRLPSTREEVRGIAALYPGAKTFLGEHATEGNVKAVAKEARYLHIASHAVLDEGLPLNSGLALTVPEKPEPGKDNGLLQAWEIFDGLRIDADLVTLSACKTALGKDMGGEGLLGLTRAFQYAGARTVLASLWSVADRSTAKLMRRFYGYLAEGKSKDQALRAAQVEMLRSGGAASHPRHWGAFELFGDWR